MREPEGSVDPVPYWEERLQTFDLSAVGYAGLGLPYNRWLYRVRRPEFRRIVRSVRRDWDGLDVLDIGSGTGFYVEEWKRLHASVTGSDLTSVAVENLSRAFSGTPFVQFDVSEEPPFPPESFDAISSFDVLYHIVDDCRYEAAFANIASLLKVGGYFIFSENFLHREAVRAAHQVSRSLQDVETLLARVGLELVRRQPMFVLMNAPIDSRSRLLRTYWDTLTNVLTRFPASGGVVGALLYPLERLLVALCKESPTTEFAVCRKSRSPMPD